MSTILSWLKAQSAIIVVGAAVALPSLAAADTEPPVATIFPPMSTITAGGPVHVSVGYSDDVGIEEILLTTETIVLHSTGTADADVNVISYGGGSMVTLANITGDGTLAFSLLPGAARDAAGNLSGAAGPSEPITIDNTSPTVTLATPSPLQIGGSTPYPREVVIAYTVTDSSPITLYSAGLEYHTTGTYQLGGGSGYFNGVDSGEVRIGINSPGSGVLAASMPAGYFRDAAGNHSAPAGPTPEVTIDLDGPVISDITVTPDWVKPGTTVTISFTASEPLQVDGPTALLVRLSDWQDFVADFESTGPQNRYNYTWVAEDLYSSSLSVLIDAYDLMGNRSYAYEQYALVVDGQPPYFWGFMSDVNMAGLGDEVMITFHGSEALPTSPTVTVDGESASYVSWDGETNTYTYKYVVTATSPEGSRQVTAAGYDFVGNYGESASPHALFYTDRTAPAFSLGFPLSQGFVRTGFPISIPINSSEMVTQFSLSIDGTPTTQTAQSNGMESWFAYEPAPGTPDGPKDGVAAGIDYYGNEGLTTLPAILSVDNTPPATVVWQDDATHSGTDPFTVYFQSTDAGCGVSSATVLVKGPGSSTYEATHMSMPWSPGVQSVTISPSSGSGTYQVVVIASDILGNLEAIPAEPDLKVVVNASEGGPMTVDVPAGDSVLVFPLDDLFDTTITLTGVTAPGTLTVSRVSPLPPGSEPPYFRRPADLLREALTITATGGLLSGGFTATLEWSFDPALTPGSGIDRVYRFEGNLNSPTGIYTVTMIGGSGKLRVTGIDGFSTWYAGNAAAVPVSISGIQLE